MQRDVLHAHEDEGAQDGDEQYGTDDQAAAQPHEHQEHHDDDAHRLCQVDEEIVDGRGHRLGLQVDGVQFHTQRGERFELGKTPCHRFPHGDHVAAGHRGDGDADGGLPVVTQVSRGGVLIAPFDVSHVPQEDQRAALGRAPPDQQVAELLFRCEFTGGIDRDELPAQGQIARRGHQVLGGKGLVNVLLGYAEVGHFFPAHLHVDGLGLDAIEHDALDALGMQQFPLEKLGVFVKLLVGVPFAGDGREDAVDIAEIVVDDRRSGPRRQAALGVTDLASQLVPHLGEHAAVVTALDDHLDLGEAARGTRFHIVELAHGLDRFLYNVGHLLFHLRGRRAGVGGEDHGLFDGEIGVFQLGQVGKRYPSDHHHQDGQHPGDHAFADAKLGDVHCS